MGRALPAHFICQDFYLDFPIHFQIFMQIEELLLEYQPTLLFVEHDETFRNKIATKMV